MLKQVGLALSLAVFGVTGCSPAPSEPSELATSTVAENPYFSVTVTGAGPDVILVPGLASSGAVWDGVVASLQDRFTLHVIHVRGFAGLPAGGNAGNENILHDLTDGLADYSAGLSGSPVLIGHSLGGLVAMQTALDPEANMRQLVIVDVLPFFSVLMDPAATAESIAPVSAFMKATMLGQSDEVFATRQEEALRALVNSEDDVQRTLIWSLESDRAVMAQAMSEVLVTDLRSEVAAISVPTLIIYANNDAIPNMAAIKAFYESLYARVPDHALLAIEDAFHFIMLDQPDAFLDAIETAL